MGLILLDSNILIDLFNDLPAAEDEISYHDNIAISAITWTEVAVKFTPSETMRFDSIVRDLPIYVLHTDDAIIREATRLRARSLVPMYGRRKLKTPDAIILATANVTGRTIVTRNGSDFAAARMPVRVPYQYSDGVVSRIAPAP